MVQKDKEKLNCWEFMKCGREKGGKKSAELGVCPAFTEMVLHRVHDGQNCGRACWVVKGTLCDATVQGSFQEKFKKCIRCGFFHYVETQEGNKLRSAPELLQMVQSNKIINADRGTKELHGPIAACKGCARELRISMDPNWNINVVGIIEFQCRNCGQILRTKGLLSDDPDGTVTLNINAGR